MQQSCYRDGVSVIAPKFREIVKKRLWIRGRIRVGVETRGTPIVCIPSTLRPGGSGKSITTSVEKITGNPFACCAYARFNRSSDDGYYLSGDGLRPGFPARLFFASVFLSGAIVLSL